MSSFNQPKECNKGCHSMIYFDRNSLVGHPQENVWLPLEYKEGRKTDTLHNCPKKNGSGTLNVPTTASAKTISPPNYTEDVAIEALTQEFRTLLTHITGYLKEQQQKK
jgi:hypothetical protein